MTIPNLITFGRLLLVPFCAGLAYATGAAWLLTGAALFAVAAFSDWLDGYLARRLDSHSRIGVLMDPVVDKVMVLAVLFVFAEQGVFPLWLVLLNMFREFLVTGMRHAFSTEGRVVGANWMGKTKFVLQVGVVELAYVHLALAARGTPLPGGRALPFWALAAATAFSYLFLLNFARWHLAELKGESSTE